MTVDEGRQGTTRATRGSTGPIEIPGGVDVQPHEKGVVPMTGWIGVKDGLPEPGVPVIVYATVYEGKKRRLRAQHAPPFTLACHPDTVSGEEDYDEKTDEYYCEEGWYETNEFEEVHWRVDGEVTHWQPLPDPPKEEA